MPGPRRRQGDTISQPGPLLDTMRRCRDALIGASTGVRPYGTAYHAIHMVTTAIDSLAYFITGQRHHFTLPKSPHYFYDPAKEAQPPKKDDDPWP